MKDLTYTIGATNGSGLSDAASSVVGFSNNGGASWSYAPVGGSCGAPVGYDDCITHIRWTMAGTMQADESFSVEFVARVK